MVALAEPASALQGPFVAAAEPDGHVLALCRQRSETDLFEVMEAAVERSLVAAPQLPPDRDRFFQVRAADLETVSLANVLELGCIPADADTHDQPAT